MTARELRAEARAWRLAAEGYTGRRARSYAFYTPFGALTARRVTDQCDRSAYDRYRLHVYATGPRFEFEASDTETAIWCCLFLALECEDEARALGRGAR